MKFAFGLLVVVVVLAAACSGGDGKTDTPIVPPESPTSAAETATAFPATPTPTALFDAKDLKAGPPVPFPPGVVMYAIDGVWEGPTAAFRRYYRDAAGQFRTDTLVLSTFGQGRSSDRAVVGVEFGRPGEVAVALCHGSCYGSPEPVTIARSSDGGVTWHDEFDVEAGGWGTLVAIDGDTTIIRGSGAGDWWTFQAVTPAGRTVLTLPPGVPPKTDSLNRFDSGGRVAVYSEDRRTVWDVLSGKQIVTVPAAWDVQRYSAGLITREGKESLEAMLYQPDAADRTTYLGFMDTTSGAVTDMYRARESDGLGNLWVAGWLTPTLGIGRADFDQADYLPGNASFFHGIPAIFDLEKGTVSPIAEFLDKLTGKAGGPAPLMTLSGAFARVKTGPDCLNVRVRPDVASASLGCLADGVLLPRRSGESADGWLPVSTPDGRDGWASTEFLEAFP